MGFRLGPRQIRASGTAAVPPEVGSFRLFPLEMGASGSIGNWWGLRVSGWTAHALVGVPPASGETPAPPASTGELGPPYANDIPEAVA